MATDHTPRPDALIRFAGGQSLRLVRGRRVHLFCPRSQLVIAVGNFRHDAFALRVTRAAERER
jgi:hypothetical protein